MPFDGAEFLPLPLRDRPESSTRTEETWRRRLRALFEATIKQEKLFKVAPESEALATLRLLCEARQLIEAPQHWTQGTYKTLGGRYCAVGALRAVGRRAWDAAAQSAAHDLLLAVARQRGFPSIESMNDYSGHEQVLSAFDEAIAAARQRISVPAP